MTIEFLRLEQKHIEGLYAILVAFSALVTVLRTKDCMYFLYSGKDKRINSKYKNMLIDTLYKNIKFMTDNKIWGRS